MAGSLFAQSISSTSVSGDERTINGTSFGSHSDYNTGEEYLNKRWDDFDDNVIDDQFDIGGSPSLTGSGTINRTGSDYCFAHGYDADGDVSDYAGVRDNTVNEFYTTYWVMKPDVATLYINDEKVVSVMKDPEYAEHDVTLAFIGQEELGESVYIDQWISVEGTECSLYEIRKHTTFDE